MNGALSGVQTRISEHAKWALYINRHAHRLNLVIVDTCKSIKEAYDFFCHSRIYSFVSGSYVHNEWVKLQREKFPNERPG